jgi:hypothetical protein
MVHDEDHQEGGKDEKDGAEGEVDNRVGREAEEDPTVEIIATLILAYKFITFSAIIVYYCAHPSTGKCDECTWKLFVP